MPDKKKLKDLKKQIKKIKKEQKILRWHASIAMLNKNKLKELKELEEQYKKLRQQVYILKTDQETKRQFSKLSTYSSDGSGILPSPGGCGRQSTILKRKSIKDQPSFI